MKRPTILILLAWLGSGISCAFSADHYHGWKLGLGFDDPISDLDQWVADNFSDTPSGDPEYWKPQRFHVDIDQDGVPEVFVTSFRLHGNGGGPHLIFQKRGASYYYAGQLPGRQHTMRVLPRDEDGFPRIMTFWNNGGGSGTARAWRWDGRGFIQVSAEVVHSGDSGTEEGRRRFDELFGPGEAASDRDRDRKPSGPSAEP